MQKKKKKKKKYGFTLIEIIAVISIIGVLSSILVPSIKGYLIDSKKVIVKEQARDLVVAIEAIQINKANLFSDEDTIDTIKSNNDKRNAINQYLGNIDDLDKISNIKVKDAKQIVNEACDFEIGSNGEFINIK